MIREILEQNGKFKKYAGRYELDGEWGSINKNETSPHWAWHTPVFIKFENANNIEKSYYGIAITLDEAIEQACRQYVKQNGFKLEWFGCDGITEYYLSLSNKKDFSFEMIGANDRYEHLDKLFAWLYANDIKVVE